MLLGYKPVQHVITLNTSGNCNTMVFAYLNIGKEQYIYGIKMKNSYTWVATYHEWSLQYWKWLWLNQ